MTDTSPSVENLTGIESPQKRFAQQPSPLANHPRLRSIGRWYIGETLGKGGYSWVKKGYDKKTGKPVALKFMTKAESNWAEEQTRQVITEIESLKQIRNRHVMKLYAYNLHAKYPTKTREKIDVILLVLEYAPGGELFDILYYTSSLEEDIARTYFRHMILGIEACHNAGVAHRDIKPQNLLLDSHFNLKLTDFGLSKIFESDSESVMNTHYVGTRGYQAPELLLKQPFGQSCDIFSAGVVLFIILTGYPPFEHANRKDRWYRPMLDQAYKRFWRGHRNCSIDHNEPAKDIIQAMLEFDPDDRISIDEIKAHPWYNGPVLEGHALIMALRTRHSQMKAKRQNDLKKVEDLQQSITRRPIPGLEPRLEAPLFPMNGMEMLKDIRTVVSCHEVLEQANAVLGRLGAFTEFDREEFKLTVSTKLQKTGASSLVKFEIRLWRANDGSDVNIVRFKRLEGDAYDFFKVRQVVEKECNPVFVGEEGGVEEDDFAIGAESDDDDYDAVLAQGETDPVV